MNNLVSTSLWHRLACVDLPSNLFSRIQAVLVEFFWEKLHWIPQAVLFLPKDEGGQGLVHLTSRGAAFHLQFLAAFRFMLMTSNSLLFNIYFLYFKQSLLIGL